MSRRKGKRIPREPRAATAVSGGKLASFSFVGFDEFGARRQRLYLEPSPHLLALLVRRKLALPPLTKLATPARFMFCFVTNPADRQTNPKEGNQQNHRDNDFKQRPH